MIQPSREPSQRRKGREGFEAGQLARKFINHPLDQKITQTDAGKTGLRIGDRIKNRYIGFTGREIKIEYLRLTCAG